MKKIIPTEEQKEGLERTKKWWLKQYKQIWTVVGEAGTGKSTFISMILNALKIEQNDVLYMTYIGRAALNLVMKGVNAQTIHSAIYNFDLVPKLDENNEVLLVNGHTVTVPVFTKKESLMSNIKLIVIDEGSMVPENIAKDVMSFNIPIIVLGDLAQLPPVFGLPFFLKNPDVILTQHMRHTRDSPIYYLANKATKGEYIKPGKYGNNCFVLEREYLNDTMLLKSDAVICGKNSTRNEINYHVRHDLMKIDKDFPVVGDKMVCRQNNWKLCLKNNIFLINGMVGYIKNIYMDSYSSGSIDIDFQPDFFQNSYFEKISMDYKYLMCSDKSKYGMSRTNKFEYAYAITCHLAQGSEYDTVLIFDERMGTSDFYNHWLYTAITRASKNLIIIKPERKSIYVHR
jgi:exodeoxyribonuclease-5